MKHNILGFSQKVAKELKLTMDELLILRWFIDFKETGKMEKVYKEDINNMMYWVTYEKIIEDLPILLGDNSIEASKKKIQRLLNGNLSNVINRTVVKNANGTKLYLSVNENVYITLVDTHWTNLSNPLDKSVQPVGQKCPNKDIPINNIPIINKDNNIYSSAEPNERAFDYYVEVIAYLNQKAGTNYKSSSEANKKLIHGRVTDGYTLEDFKKVIDNKCLEWLGTEHEKYLRPSTLFRASHFDEYLNQKINKTTGGTGNEKGNEYNFTSVRSVQREHNDSSNKERDFDF